MHFYVYFAYFGEKLFSKGLSSSYRLDNEKLKSEFVTMLKDIEEKLEVKVRESDAIDEEKETLNEEMAKLADSKRKLELEIDIMENVIGKQVKKIDDLSTKCYLSKELESDLQSKTQLIESKFLFTPSLHRDNTTSIKLQSVLQFYYFVNFLENLPSFITLLLIHNILNKQYIE